MQHIQVPNSGQGQIILVDDDSVDRSFVKDAFKEIQLNAKIIELEDGEEAIDYFKQTAACEVCKVVILDVNLPKFTGLEILEFCNLRLLNNMSVIVFSTSTRDSDKNKALSLGAKKYIVKPSDFKGYIDVARHVEELLSNEA